MKNVIAIVACFAIAACGREEKQKTGEASPTVSKVEQEPFTGDVQFSGYVQKAFTIKVNGKSFKDSEDFYTRFIQELVKPSYKDIAASDVTLEGDYGLDEFGSDSKVYMSSVASDGHLFEGLTDAQSKFTLTVKAEALDETFKARVAVRIGLKIAKAGADWLHYCYILNGSKDSIAVSEKSKPIIFDDFDTELTAYKCDEDGGNDKLIIPDAEKKADPAPAPAPATTTPAPESTTDAQTSGTGSV